MAIRLKKLPYALGKLAYDVCEAVFRHTKDGFRNFADTPSDFKERQMVRQNQLSEEILKELKKQNKTN